MVQEAIRDGDLTQGAVLVVLVPAREANLAEFRDYIVESLSSPKAFLGFSSSQHMAAAFFFRSKIRSRMGCQYPALDSISICLG